MPGKPLPYQPVFNYPNNKLYQYEAYPVLVNCNFVVDSTNGNGLGIRQLKGAGVANVFMNTSATPGVGNYGKLNPNPVQGAILVQFQNNFNRYISGFSGIIPQLTGSSIPITGLTAGRAYVITSLGTSQAADWVAAGLPVGMTAQVGAAFIATGVGTGSGTVQQSSGEPLFISPIGDPNATLSNSNIYQNGGAQMILYMLNASGSLTAPLDGSVVGLSFLMSNSSVAVSGQ